MHCLAAAAGLASLRSVSLAGNRLAALGSLQPCRHLTSLCLAGNRLADGCALVAAMPASLVTLDVSANQLPTLAGLAGACPLLRMLRAAGNPLQVGLLLLHTPRQAIACARASAWRMACFSWWQCCSMPFTRWFLPHQTRQLPAQKGHTQMYVQEFPADLHLPFLRELGLGGCGLAAVPRWPWLPSLRHLDLQARSCATPAFDPS